MEPLDPRLLTSLASQIECETIVGRVSLTETLISDPEDPAAPAHAKLLFQRQRIEGTVESERWLLAESWWAETFAPPSFGDLARWGLGVIPWAVGSHIGVQVSRVWVQRPWTWHDIQGTAQSSSWQPVIRWLVWPGRVVAAFLKLSVGITLATPLLLAALAVLIPTALLPIPQLRELLLTLQLKIASTLGDSYMLVSRPIEAASIVGQVRRDLEWLAKHCNVVAVVAHSQGGAVAHKALQRDVPPQPGVALHVRFRSEKTSSSWSITSRMDSLTFTRQSLRWPF